jgi:hypothetical protein
VRLRIHPPLLLRSPLLSNRRDLLAPKHALAPQAGACWINAGSRKTKTDPTANMFHLLRTCARAASSSSRPRAQARRIGSEERPRGSLERSEPERAPLRSSKRGLRNMSIDYSLRRDLAMRFHAICMRKHDVWSASVRRVARAVEWTVGHITLQRRCSASGGIQKCLANDLTSGSAGRGGPRRITPRP